MSIKHLVKCNILKLKPYQSARKLGGKGNIWLNANEYPLTPKYICNIKNLNRYPECQPSLLINKYANYVNIKSKQVLVCRGADEGISLLIRAFCDFNKDKILFCPPTYGMYKVSSEILGIKFFEINTINNWQLDLNKIINNLKNVKLIYLCNPNNPTGNIINHNDIIYLLKIIKNKALLVIDEAYIDFCLNFSLTYLIEKNENLVILRTLSKAFALAGIRCGFILSNSYIIKILTKIIDPYPIPSPVIDIASQALSENGIKQTKLRIMNIHYNKAIFIKDLKECKCVMKVYSSLSNYCLVKFDSRYQVFKSLWNKGIILRDQSLQPGLIDCIRITIGTLKECKQIIKILKILKPNKLL
ncbi:MAG: histidinol-phosphate transaminase [Enterobacterales bacterium]